MLIYVSLITFNNTGTSHPVARRQSTTPLVYNITQEFAASAGTVYTLSAFAADAQNGDTTPDCALTICGDDSCGPSTPLTSDYSPYPYQYYAGLTETSAIATFSVQCAQSAYAALVNVTVVSNSASSGASAAAITTATVTQFVTRTQTV